MSPDQWALLGSASFILAITLGVIGVIHELRRP